jgi:hypothetical protein
MTTVRRRLAGWKIASRLLLENRLSSPYSMPATSSRWTTTPVRGSFARPGTAIQRAPFVSRTLPTFRTAWTLGRWRSTSESTALAEVRSNPCRETHSDITTYRGLSNGAQAVEIGMAGTVSGNPLSAIRKDNSAPMAAVLKRAAGRAPSCARTTECAARRPRLSGSFNRWRLPGAVDNRRWRLGRPVQS